MSDSLQALSDQEILEHTRELVARERALTLAVLLHLNEIERRQLHLKFGFSSMFDYCTLGLGYSASAASRRIRTARCLARFPKIHTMLSANDVNLSTVAQVSKVLTVENHIDVLERIRGKSQKEVEVIAAEYDQLAAVPRERIRTVAIATWPQHAPAHETQPPLPTLDTLPKSTTAAVVNSANVAAATRTERRTLLQFSADDTFMNRLAMVRALAAHRLRGNASIEQLVEFLLDYFIDREDPAARHRKRQARRRSDARPNRAGQTRSAREIPAHIRDAVFVRDGGRCTYVGSDDRRCNSTFALQLDHIVPVALGGTSTPDNLRLLCAKHNRLEAERLLGPSRVAAS